MARLAGAGIAAACAVFAACFSTPRFQGADDARRGTSGSDAPIDTMFLSVDGAPGKCVSDDFAGSGSSFGCGSSGWATLNYSGGSAAAGGGQLELQMSTAPSGYVRCVSDTAAAYTRFTVDVISAGQTASGDTTFVGLDNGTNRFGALFTWSGIDGAAGFQVLCGGGPIATTGTLPSDARFIQIVEVAADSVAIGASLDGDSYRQIGSCYAGSGGLDSTLAKLSLDRNAGASAPLSSVFGSIELCHE